LATDLIQRSPAEHVEKAIERLRATRGLLDLGLWAPATASAYYAALHAAHALLATIGLEPMTHAGTHQLLGQHFIKDGPLPPSLGRAFGHLMTDRETADYGAPRLIDEAGAREATKTTDGVVRPVLALVATRDPAAAPLIADALAELDRLAQRPPAV
jgi:uncharacterized protein (UPF0332 family)